MEENIPAGFFSGQDHRSDSDRDRESRQGIHEKTDEDTLLARAKNGDVEAFEELVKSHEKRIYNIALRMFANPEDAREMTQEVLIKMFKTIKDFKGQSSFSTWLYRVSTNTCLDEIRKRKNNRVVSLQEPLELDNGDSIAIEVPDKAPGPEGELEKREARREIFKAMEALTSDQRMAVILRDVQGLSYEEIAQVLKLPEGTVKSRINRARSELKGILSKGNFFHFVSSKEKEKGGTKL